MEYHVGYRYLIDDSNRTSTADRDDWIRDMIEQVLFTTPGERVNRPDFGSGLLQLIFSPNSNLLGDALQLTVQAALQQHLSDLIEVTALEVKSEEAMVRVNLQYRIQGSDETTEETFVREV